MNGMTDNRAGEINGADASVHSEHPSEDPSISAPPPTTANTGPRRRLLIERGVSDHFTLSRRSHTITLGGAGARVFEAQKSQFLLEQQQPGDGDEGEEKLQVKELKHRTRGLSFLRGLYTIMCLIFHGLFLVFCLEILLGLVLEVTVFYGTTETESFLVTPFLGTTISLFVLIEGFSDFLVVLWNYTNDAFAGHVLVKKFFYTKRFSPVLIDWVFFFFLIFAPIFTGCVLLLMQNDLWWTYTALTWIGSVGFMGVVFTFLVVFFEISGAYKIVRSTVENKSAWNVARECILIRQRRIYSGLKHTTVIATSQYPADAIESTRKERIGLWSRMTVSCLNRKSCFEVFKEPKSTYKIDDLIGYYPVISKDTWSLERAYCRPKDSRYCRCQW